MSAVISHPGPNRCSQGHLRDYKGSLNLHPVWGCPLPQYTSLFSLLLGVKLPADLDAGQRKHPLSFLDWILVHALLPAYFLSSFAFCCHYIPEQSRRKNVLSVFLPLPLPGLIPVARMSSKGRGRRRIPFRSMSGAGDGQGCVQSQSQPYYWPQPFPAFLVTALSFALAK